MHGLLKRLTLEPQVLVITL